MVDYERLDARPATDVKVTQLACSTSSGFACTRPQTEQLSVTDTTAGDDGIGQRVVDNEDRKSTIALSDDTSDPLRHIVIDGSNIAMRLQCLQYFI